MLYPIKRAIKPVLGVPVSYRRKREYKSQWRKLNSRVGYYRNYKRGQNLTKNVYWFKTCGDIKAVDPGTIFLRISANDTYPIPSFVNECRNWSQYKVLKVIIKAIPAYVGSETFTVASPPGGAYRRGNCISYIVQANQASAVPSQPTEGNIANILGYPSAKLHQPRATVKRWMNRTSGGRYADWAFINHPTPLGEPSIDTDVWNSEIRIFGDGFGVGNDALNNKPYYFVEYYFKVVFRSRWRGGVIQTPLPLPISNNNNNDEGNNENNDEEIPR